MKLIQQKILFSPFTRLLWTSEEWLTTLQVITLIFFLLRNEFLCICLYIRQIILRELLFKKEKHQTHALTNSIACHATSFYTFHHIPETIQENNTFFSLQNLTTMFFFHCIPFTIFLKDYHLHSFLSNN